jgi:putative flippase GtrA
MKREENDLEQSFFQRNRKLIFEFLRYVVVGGVSAVVDMGVNFVMLFYVLGGTKDDKGLVAASVAAGFIVGLAVNFILSNIFVFKEKEQREKGKTLGAFLIYTLVGVIGFGLTELLTILGTLVIGEGGVWYLVLTCFVKGVVLIWNYVGRKILVYRGK